jgi:2,5-diketo-D-gluconate reductase B
MKTVTAHSVTIPALGMGTWELRGDECARLVETAIGQGYRHIDTAQMYQNEREVGEGIRASGVPREDIFLTTKIWPDCHAADDFARAVDERLKLLDCGPVDLLLLHWPSRTVPLARNHQCPQQGASKRPDPSHRHFKLHGEPGGRGGELSDAPLICNQLEYHPLINQTNLLAACRAQRLAITAYCPIARNRVADEPVMQEIAARHGVSPSDITLAWHMAQGDVMAIPRSSKPERLASNLAASQIEPE